MGEGLDTHVDMPDLARHSEKYPAQQQRHLYGWIDHLIGLDCQVQFSATPIDSPASSCAEDQANTCQARAFETPMRVSASHPALRVRQQRQLALDQDTRSLPPKRNTMRSPADAS